MIPLWKNAKRRPKILELRITMDKDFIYPNSKSPCVRELMINVLVGIVSRGENMGQDPLACFLSLRTVRITNLFFF